MKRDGSLEEEGKEEGRRKEGGRREGGRRRGEKGRKGKCTESNKIGVPEMAVLPKHNTHIPSTGAHEHMFGYIQLLYTPRSTHDWTSCFKLGQHTSFRHMI